MKEIWKDIHEYEGYYQVSNKGNVRSLDRYVVANNKGGTKLLKGRSMKLTQTKGRDGHGYMAVNLRKNGTSKVKLVHILVAEAFLPNLDKLPTVNHIDGDKTNNNVNNLEWCSYRDNNIHALYNKLRQPRGREVVQKDENGEIVNIYKSVTEASRQTGISRGMISHCLNGRCEFAGNYKWTYKIN